MCNCNRTATGGTMQPVIWHDHQISPKKCKDAATGGKDFTYSGKYISNLTLAQAKVGFPPRAPHAPTRGVFWH